MAGKFTAAAPKSKEAEGGTCMSRGSAAAPQEENWIPQKQSGRMDDPSQTVPAARSSGTEAGGARTARHVLQTARREERWRAVSRTGTGRAAVGKEDGGGCSD